MAYDGRDAQRLRDFPAALTVRAGAWPGTAAHRPGPAARARHLTLVYAFGPYGQFARNIGQVVVLRLRPGPDRATVVFDTSFDRGMLLDAVRRHRPDLIVGVGQYRSGGRLRLERRAVNQMGRRGGRRRPIDRTGPAALFATLDLPETPETTVSDDAGTYVCNFTMYWMLAHCRRAGCRFAFLHIPRHYDVAAAAAYLERAVRSARRRARRRR